jgi:hypothetical protein
MAWTDFFVGNLPNAKMLVTQNGRPFISMAIDKGEFIEVRLTENENELPFEVSFKKFDDLGVIVEERIYGYAGTKDLAKKLAMDVALFRQNSFDFVLDGE